VSAEERKDCELRAGQSGIVLVAPHAGRRPPVDATAPPRRLRVNDLYTAEVSGLLGKRLRATTLVNRGLDRNHVDLNRVSDVSRQAPWFGELLAEVIEATLRRHDHVEVVFLHGWHIGQPRCDIGIGAVEVDGHLRLPAGAGLTVGESYLRRRVRRLQRACAARGIGASLGERYPASHRNNVLQVFCERGREGDPRWAQTIAAWCGAGRVSALQLELGAPLRWPGVWRERLLDALGEAFDAGTSFAEVRRQSAPAADGGPATPSRLPTEEARVQPVDLQFYDAAENVGALAGIGPVGTGRLAGRLLFFLGQQRVALFTGEARAGDGPQVSPLRAWRDADTVRWSFSGPVLSLDDAALYVDLEAALAASHLQLAELHASFVPTADACAETGAQFGRVDGVVRIGGRTRRINSAAFAGVRALPSMASGHAVISMDLEGRAIVAHATSAAAGAVAVEFAAEGPRQLCGAQLRIRNGPNDEPQQFELGRHAAEVIRGEPMSRMTILRPAGPDAYLRVAFGVARFHDAGRRGTGFYNIARRVAAHPGRRS
jgi:hypothetical protein